MTATALPLPTLVTRAGVTAVTPAAMDAVNGNTFLNDGHTGLEITNSDSSTHTLTIHLAYLVDGQAAASRVVTITAGVTKRYAKIPVKEYGAKVLLTVDSALLKAATYRAG
jgi:hypothetical protein